MRQEIKIRCKSLAQVDQTFFYTFNIWCTYAHFARPNTAQICEHCILPSLDLVWCVIYLICHISGNCKTGLATYRTRIQEKTGQQFVNQVEKSEVYGKNLNDQNESNEF